MQSFKDIPIMTNNSEVNIWCGSESMGSNPNSVSFLNKKYSIVFDLDNTLVYTTPLQTEYTSFVIYQQKNTSHQAKSTTSLSTAMVSEKPLDATTGTSKRVSRYSIPRSKKRKFFVQIRPGLIDFLQCVSQNFNIFFYTASEREYAKEVVSKILKDASNTPSTKCADLTSFEYYLANLDKIIFSRECCKFMHGYELKDLSILNLPLTDIILVDDIQGSGLLQPMNSLIIPPFYGDINDNFLTDELLPLLTKCSQTHELIANIRRYAKDISPHLTLYGDEECKLNDL